MDEGAVRAADRVGRLLLVAALLGAAALFGAAAPAAGADDVRVYEVEGRGAGGRVLATCDGDTCSVVPEMVDAFFPGVWTEPLTVRGGRGRLTMPDTCGTSSTDPYASHNRIVLTVTITGSELVATRAEAGGTRTPRAGFTCTNKALTLTERASLVPPAAPEPDGVRSYEGRWGPDRVRVTVTCSDGACSALLAEGARAFDGAWAEPIPLSGGRGRVVVPTRCEDGPDSHGRQTVEVSVTDASLTATYRVAKEQVRTNGVICYFNADERTVAAALVAPATPTATPSPEPGAGTTDGAAPGGPAPPGVAGPGDGVVASADGPGGLTVSRLATGAADAPSVLSGLRTPASVDVGQTLVAALVTVVLVLLLAFPTSLLNSAVETGTDRFSAWWRRRSGRGEQVDDDGVPWWWAAAGVLAAGVVSSFVDPQFGMNAGSVRTLLSVVVGVSLEVVLGWVVVAAVVRRTVPDATPSFSFAPATLLLVAGAVVLTRVTGFEPGIVFGLVAGIGFATVAGRAAKARVTLVPLAVGAAVALLAWALYPLASGSTGTVGVFVAETLSATAVGGLVALPLALVPVPGLGGHTVFSWDRRVWAGCYSFGLFAFFVVLMPTPYAWGEVSWSLLAWVLVYLAYLAVAVSAWWLVRRGRADAAVPADPGASDELAVTPSD